MERKRIKDTAMHIAVSSQFLSKVKERANSLGQSVSEYIRYLILKDLEEKIVQNT